jgi:hypothetical protein
MENLKVGDKVRFNENQKYCDMGQIGTVVAMSSLGDLKTRVQDDSLPSTTFWLLDEEFDLIEDSIDDTIQVNGESVKFIQFDKTSKPTQEVEDIPILTRDYITGWSDEELVKELRRRGYTVKATKTIEL